MRRIVTFPCAGETLVGSLDEGAGKTGLLIVSGGNEIRCGAHRGMALLAHRLAERGHSVFRFDRRGIGDASGDNRGFRESAPDIAAAAATFTAAAQLTRLVAFGNCDAATALALFHADLALDALVLANPWVGGDDDGLPPAAAIRDYYEERLRDPRSLLRIVRSDIDFRRLFKGLRKVFAPRAENPLAAELEAALIATRVPVTIVLAARDATALAFADAWKGDPRIPIHRLATDSHSFANPGDAAALEDILVAALSR